MIGACADCMLIDSTLSDGIEIILQEEVPGVIGVKLAKDMPKKEEDNQSIEQSEVKEESAK